MSQVAAYGAEALERLAATPVDLVLVDVNMLVMNGMEFVKRMAADLGIEDDRLRLEWVSAGEGVRFAEVMNDFSRTLTKLGPLGKEIDPKVLKLKLEGIRNLLPYIKLVERERLRVPHKSEKEYIDFFTSDEFDRLFQQLIGDRLVTRQIVALLREKPLSTGEISEELGLVPSEVSAYLKSSARQGLVHFDEDRKRYVAA